MRRTLLLLPLWLISMLLFAQNPKDDFTDAEFFLAEEEYEEALFVYEKVYNNGYQDNASINYRMGICLLQIQGRKTEAIPYLEKAVQKVSEKYREGNLKEENAPVDAHLYLGNAYRINMEFEKACEQYRLFDEYVGEAGDISSVFAAQQITSCSNAVVAINDPVDVSIGNLGQITRTHSNVYNVVVSHDMQTMAYMGKNPFYNGVYVSRKGEDGLWGRPLGINASIVSEGNMNVVGLSSDGNQMLLIVSDAFVSNIYLSEYSDDRWNPANSMGKPVNSRYFESHASFSPDGGSIYFTSNRNGSMGGMDIYRSQKQEDGSWGEPENLGEPVNTPLNEETPVLSPDGKRLYFASQGHTTIGGFDIFSSDLQEDGSWGEPVNLGYPLNTTDDDFTIAPAGFSEEGIAFIYSNSKEGQHPLFKFEIIAPDAVAQVVPFDEEEEEVVEVVEEAPEEEVVEEAPEEEVVVVVPPPVKTPEEYLIKPVFFAFDSYALSPESQGNLNRMAELMNKFTDLELEIIGHTDAMGPFEYNQQLSLNRAKAVSDFLESKGVVKDRLSLTGKSESEAIARNTIDDHDAPEGRKLNRRVEFKVSVIEGVVVEMETIDVPDHLKLD